MAETPFELLLKKLDFLPQQEEGQKEAGHQPSSSAQSSQMDQ